MQTLRKKSSPCKYKNEPARFLGDGMTFKAKLIGILEVNEARGDKMCQDALNDLKTAVRAAGEHKQRITISIAIDGLRLRDEKTGDSMYHHPVHKISFIAQDMSDSRAFGYIFGSPDTGHRFFGIKTDKTASQVVIAMRDLFQVVFELKKKEIEMAKHHIEQHQLKYGSGSFSGHVLKDEPHSDKSKTKTTEQRTHSSSHSTHESVSAKVSTDAASSRNSEAIADLLDLEDELNSIQQGISQMDRITPSDPFGPLSSKGEHFLDSFKEKVNESTTATVQKSSILQKQSQVSKESSDGDKSASVFGSAASTSSRAHFFPQFSPTSRKSKDETYWFDQETESLFSDAVASQPEPTTSPVTFHTPTGESDVVLEEKKSPNVTDLFTDLDPLGTGKVRPYKDKKEFFQELKNPPKKVLKELISEPPKQEGGQLFSSLFDGPKSPQVSSSVESSVIKNTLAYASSNILSSFPPKESKYSRIDPFEETDPFEKTDPFLEESYPKSIGFPPLLTAKASVDVGQERVTFHYDKVSATKSKEPSSPPLSDVFSSSIHGPLRVSLPPEKPDTNTTISLSSIASRFRSSPSPTEETKSHRRRHYQALKQSTDDRSDDQYQSPILEEVYVRGSPKSFTFNTFDRKYFVGSPPPVRSEKIKQKISSSLELLDSTPEPPPRQKTALFAIKPPPLPPKKQNQPIFRPPARPPSLEETSQYDYLIHEVEQNSSQKDSGGSPKKRKGSIQNQSDSFSRQHSADQGATHYPILPPPPQRKTPTEASSRSHSITNPKSVRLTSQEKSESSVLNITLNQLDQSGFESLAATLGIPTENVCNMTLQELTKMLAQKYLGAQNGEKIETCANVDDSSFQADFEANFGDSSTPKSTAPTYDKYAVFKELLEDGNVSERVKEDETEEEQKPEEPPAISKKMSFDSSNTNGEDRYAALRQLSLCAQKSENLSEDLDISNEDDSSARADNISDIIKHNTDDSFTPLHNLEMNNESPVAKAVLEETEKGEIEAENVETNLAEEKGDENWDKNSDFQGNEVKFDSKSIGYKDELNKSGENEFDEGGKNDWATFEKDASSQDLTNIEKSEKGNGNDNSPLSSDGKDGTKEWTVKSTKNVKTASWNYDDDESWDDYSPKESYWSDESSHDGQSPVKENIPSYHRRAWNKHQRQQKGSSTGWGEGASHWQRRWQEDTEDEYEEMWRRRRQRPSSFDRDRKRERNYDGYEKQFNWNREQWEEMRFPRNDRRKPNESAVDYRRRCDSDASDKEYVTLDRNYPDPREVKVKQYYQHPREAIERHWSDHRESRSKYKKPMTHKRPSSASEAKRYEKMYSPIDSSPRSLEKSGVRESEDEDYSSKFHPSRKDIRYHSNIEYYGSYDRRAQAMYHRRMHRGKRGGHSQKDVEMVELPINTSEKLHFFPPDTPHSSQSNKSEGTPEASKGLHFKFEDDFIPCPADRPSGLPRRFKMESPTEKMQFEDEWSKKGEIESYPTPDNNNDRFTNFNDDQESTEKVAKDKIKNDTSGGITKKPSLKGRNHFASLGRQDSTTSLRKSESINIFSRDSDPFEDDDFFSGGPGNANSKLNRFFTEKSKSNTNVSDPFSWKDMFGENKFQE